ncbi:hypothetical protein ACFL26_01840 [Patescibacteria group bacterium]
MSPPANQGQPGQTLDGYWGAVVSAEFPEAKSYGESWLQRTVSFTVSQENSCTVDAERVEALKRRLKANRCSLKAKAGNTYRNGRDRQIISVTFEYAGVEFPGRPAQEGDAAANIVFDE